MKRIKTILWYSTLLGSTLTILISLLAFKGDQILKPKDFEIKFQKEYGGTRTDAFRSLKETISGGYVCVGYSKSWSEGKEDIYIVLTDENCEQLAEKRLGRAEKDIGNAVSVAKDGGYLIAGFTESSGSGYKGGRDAVLLKLDHQLRDVWFESGQFSTIHNEEFNDLTLLSNEDIAAVGQQNNQLYLVSTDKMGQERGHFNLDDYPFSTGNAIIQNSDGDLIIVGSAGELRPESQKLLVLCISTNLEILWQRLYETEDNFTVGYDIIELKQNTYAITGKSHESKSKYKENGTSLIIDKQGNVQAEKSYGYYDEDVFFSIARDYSGNLLLGGYGQGRGDVRENGWLLMVDSSTGERKWQNDERNFLGKKARDQIHDIIQSRDGSMVLAGFTNNFPKGSQAWLLKLAPQFPEFNLAVDGDIEIENFTLIDEDQNQILTSGETGFLEVSIKNMSARKFFNLKAKVNSNNSALDNLPQLVLDPLNPLSNSKFLIPLYPKHSLDQDTIIISIELHQVDKNNEPGNSRFIGIQRSYQLATDKSAAPNLEFNNVEMISNTSGPIRRGSRMRCVANVLNTGNSTAHNVTLVYKFPEGITPLSSNWQSLQDIVPGDRRRISVEFFCQPVFFDSIIPVNLRVIDSTLEYFSDFEVIVELEEEEIVSQPVVRNLLPEWLGFGDSTDIIVNDSIFGARINMYSNEELSEENFFIYNNTKLISTQRSKLSVFTHDQANRDLYTYQYRFQAPISLRPGLNELELEVNANSGSIKTVPIKINYEPYIPALHLLSIGVPIDQIKQFASRDADVFNKTLTEVASQYFERIDSELMNNPRFTYAPDINRAFLDLKKDYLYRQKIKPEDVLLIFISSHASIATPGTFKIKSANFDGMVPDLTSTDYQENIERFLSQINCQKMIFLDVFGEREEENDDEDSQGSDAPLLSQAFINLMQKQPNSTPVILACGPGQSSEEDPKAELGIFAHAMLEALAIDNLPTIDKNRNNIITLQEFYQQLQSRIQQFATNSRKQIPYLDERFNTSDFGLIQINTYND